MSQHVFFSQKSDCVILPFLSILSIVQLILYETDEKEGNGRKPEGRRLDSSKAPGSPENFRALASLRSGC